MIEKNLLVEKYRPKNFEEYLSGTNKGFVEFLEDIVNNRPFDLPNILLHGHAGCGKSTLAKIIISELHADHLYIDASDDNGVNTIRTLVNEFSQTKARNQDSPKIIFFDEADRLTPAAQDALKNMIEQRSAQCRFIFSCNNVNKITEPLKSRVGKNNIVEITGADEDDIFYLLKNVVSNENLDINLEEISKIIDSNYPDIRSMIHSLDSIKYIGTNKSNGNIAKEFIKLFREKNKKEMMKLMSDRSLDFRNVLFDIFNEMTEDEKIDNIENIAEADYRMTVGSTPEIIMMEFVVKL